MGGGAGVPGGGSDFIAGGGPIYVAGYGGAGGLDHPLLCVQDPDDPDRCIDPNPIAEHPAAIRDGAWMRSPNAPHAVVDVGTYMRHFADPGITRGLSAPIRLGLVGTGVDHGVSGVIRAGFSSRHLYGLAELELGGLTEGPDKDMATLDLAETSFGYAGVFGLAEPIGRSRVAIEGAFGARTVVYTVDNGSSASATAPVVEARVRAETWLTPYMTVGGIAGASVIDRSDWMAGVTVGFHTLAYGGQRPD